MKVLTFAATLALASTAVAATSGLTRVRRDSSTNTTCLEQGEAETIVDKFITIMEHLNVTTANATAQDLLADSFSESSDSINTISGAPLGTISFPNKTSYLASVLYAPAPRNVTTLKVMPAGCMNIIWYWQMVIGSSVVPVQGFNLMEVDEDYKLAGQKVEFNSIAWSIDTGFTVINRAGKKLPVAGQVPGATTQTAQKSAASKATFTFVLPLLSIVVLGVWGS